MKQKGYPCPVKVTDANIKRFTAFVRNKLIIEYYEQKIEKLKQKIEDLKNEV